MLCWFIFRFVVNMIRVRYRKFWFLLVRRLGRVLVYLGIWIIFRINLKMVLSFVSMYIVYVFRDVFKGWKIKIVLLFDLIFELLIFVVIIFFMDFFGIFELLMNIIDKMWNMVFIINLMFIDILFIILFYFIILCYFILCYFILEDF